MSYPSCTSGFNRFYTVISEGKELLQLYHLIHGTLWVISLIYSANEEDIINSIKVSTFQCIIIPELQSVSKAPRPHYPFTPFTGRCTQCLLIVGSDHYLLLTCRVVAVSHQIGPLL